MAREDEWLVFLDAIDPEKGTKIPVQLFADSREVTQIGGTPKRNNPASAWLRVSLVKKQAGLSQIVLPQPATPVGESAFVPAELVKQESR